MEVKFSSQTSHAGDSNIDAEIQQGNHVEVKVTKEHNFTATEWRHSIERCEKIEGYAETPHFERNEMLAQVEDQHVATAISRNSYSSPVADEIQGTHLSSRIRLLNGNGCTPSEQRMGPTSS